MEFILEHFHAQSLFSVSFGNFILGRVEKPLNQCLERHGTLKLSSENQTTQHFKAECLASSLLWFGLLSWTSGLKKRENTSPVSQNHQYAQSERFCTFIINVHSQCSLPAQDVVHPEAASQGVEVGVSDEHVVHPSFMHKTGIYLLSQTCY